MNTFSDDGDGDANDNDGGDCDGDEDDDDEDGDDGVYISPVATAATMSPLPLSQPCPLTIFTSAISTAAIFSNCYIPAQPPNPSSHQVWRLYRFCR